MANKILSIKDYSPSSSDIFFFDNNIWMYLLCPMGNYQKDKRQREYSKFFTYLLSRELHIYTLSLVLSEFSNRYLKLDFKLQQKSVANAGKFNDYKKDYVGSEEYQQTTKALKTHLNQILKVCQKCSDEFNAIDLNSLISSFESIGFNDSYYITLALKKKWIIVSDDSDIVSSNLGDYGLTILTYQN